MSDDFTLCPYRFTPDPPAMIAFLEAVGLQPIVQAPSRSFAILQGRTGRVAVHEAHREEDGTVVAVTSLDLETPDAVAAVTGLTRLGLDAEVWDEAFGHLAGVRTPAGWVLGINEAMHDFYGYETQDLEQPAAVDVLAVLFSPDFSVETELLTHFGFHPDDESEQWLPLRGTGGVIGLHHNDGPTPLGSRPGPLGAPALVGLSFETSEPFDALVDRLHAAGYSDAALLEDGTPRVLVTDPDGESVEIYAAPNGSAGETALASATEIAV